MVDILLATYNGDRFLEKQIDSIIAQTYNDWHLLIRDDLSSDNTMKIIQRYVSKYYPKIECIYDSYGNLGVVRNFRELIKYSSAEYVMFADQDDIWDTQKIEHEISLINSISLKNRTRPIIVFTDLKGIDSNDNVIFESFNRRNRLTCDEKNFSKIMYKNIVTGCTMMMNRILVDYLRVMPDDIKVHDHWAVLVCLLNGGCLYYLDRATVLYRQHDKNVIGDNTISTLNKMHNMLDIGHYSKRKRDTVTYYRMLEYQISKLYELYYDTMDIEMRELLKGIVNIWDRNPFYRVYFICKNKCLQKQVYLNIIIILYYFMWGKRNK